MNLKTVLSLLLLLLLSRHANADIYQWAISGGSVVQSSTVCPEGGGVFATPGAQLGGLILTQAYLINANLSNADLEMTTLNNANMTNANMTGAYMDETGLANANLTGATLTNAFCGHCSLTNANMTNANMSGADIEQAQLGGANMTNANLTNSRFNNSTLTNANVTNAIVAGANLADTALTSSQLYGTASYGAGNLQGIGLGDSNLAGWSFSGQNLTNADFSYSHLTNANLGSANLTNAGFYLATLTGANFSNATVTGANFSSGNLTGALTSSQLYSTASYGAGNLQGIGLQYVNLSGWNFSAQDLSNASLAEADLANANLSNAIVTGAQFGTTALTSSQLYSTASYQAGNLQGIWLDHNNLTGWNFSGQNLTGANLTYGTLAGASFSNATVTGAQFSNTALTSSQLYSTASYQAGNLQGIELVYNNLTGWNFSGQNLTGANLSYGTLTNANLAGASLVNSNCYSAILTGANLAGANLINANCYSAILSGANLSNATVTGAQFGNSALTSSQLYSTASYQAGNLQGIDLDHNNLTGWNFSGQNLTGANLSYGTLAGASFSNATVTGAQFGNSALTSSQLYSTASYQAGNLQGIDLDHNNLTGWNFSGQNLKGAYLYSATLTNANLGSANLTGASIGGTLLTSANLTGADMRGATGFSGGSSGATTTNAILPDGTIQGLALNTTNPSLTVRNYSGTPSIAIQVQNGMSLTPSGSLVFALDGNAWGSTISFAPGIPVTLGGGNLTLGLAPGVSSSAVFGSAIQLFNWAGVTPSGQFNVVNNTFCPVDVSQLYSTGNVSIFGHALPSLTFSGSSNQTVIVGATGVTVGLSLSDGTASQTGLTSLDVNSLGLNVSGSTGGKLVASGASQPYTASLSIEGIGVQNEVFSMNVGDDHTLLGASASTNISTTATLTVLDHAAAVFVGGGTLNLSFGTLQHSSGTQSLQFQIENLPAAYRAGLDLDSVLVLANSAGVFSTDATPFTDLAPGSESGLFDLFLDPSQPGQFSGQYQFNLSDEKDLSGHAGQQTLVLDVTATVVPEPGALALVGAIAVALLSFRRWMMHGKYLASTLALAVALCASRADSQTFTTLLTFTGTGGSASGALAYSNLALSGTTFYGMTSAGGLYGDGNIFSIGINGSNYQNLVSFTGTSGMAIGRGPAGNLTLSGTTLYGMTRQGGKGFGNIFSVGTSGTNYQNLVSFTGTSGTAIGWQPYGSLTLGGTTLYGTTSVGGASDYGTVFSVGTGGTSFHNLVSFTGSSGTAVGLSPEGSLTFSGTTLYGMTIEGGTTALPAWGTIFSVGSNGSSYKNVLSFSGSGGAANGQTPFGSLTISGTLLYGMTANGGAIGDGNIFGVGTDGTNYRNLVSFTGSGGAASGWGPIGDLILSGTTLYGVTQEGGGDNYGDIFSVGTDGSDYHDFYSFTGGSDGEYPHGDMTLSAGTLFGTTSGGGANGDGTVFALTLPTPTPEPGTLLLLAAGAIGILGSRLRWRKHELLATSPGATPTASGADEAVVGLSYSTCWARLTLRLRSHGRLVLAAFAIWLSCVGQVAAAVGTGNLFEGDYNDNCIYKLTASGTRSVFAAGLNEPTALAVDGSGDLYEADGGSGRIYKFTPSGSQSTFASGLTYPNGLALDSNGNIFVSDFDSNNIYEFAPNGLRSTFASVNGPVGLAFDSHGALFVSSYGSKAIYEFATGRSQSIFASGLENPQTLVFDGTDNLFEADWAGGKIERFTSTGIRSTFASGLGHPTSLAFDNSGNLFEGDWDSASILEFTPGEIRSTFASGLNRPSALAFAPTPIPESSTLALAVAASVGLLVFRWWRNWLRFPAGIAVLAFFGVDVARADVFNMPSGQTSLQFVTVGDPGNVADLATGYGSVPYTFYMGKYDVTAAQYTAFLNAVAATDTYGLYNFDMLGFTGTTGCGISQSGSPGNYTYTTARNSNYPVNGISWGDAARFCNWLQDGQPTGAEGNGTTETGAYNMNGGTSQAALMAVTRNAGAQFFIPSENEWYKTAYYKGHGANAGYWLYPTQSNSAPGNDLSFALSTSNESNNYVNSYSDPTNYLTPVGAFAASPGTYGTFDMGGDVSQWDEANISNTYRGVRGAPFGYTPSNLVSTARTGIIPTYENDIVGFRVASSIAVPEPGGIAVMLTGGAFVFALARRRCAATRMR